MTRIHPTAIIHPGAQLGLDVSVGPYSLVDAAAVIGDRTQIGSHVVIRGQVHMGTDNIVGAGSALGEPAQHLHAGAGGGVVMGSHNCLRERVTIHAAMDAGRQTVLGDHNYLMVNAHVAHDCVVGDHTILVNNVMLGGHVIVQDRAYVGGGAGIHQHCRVGRNAIVGGTACITQDVPPFVTVDGMGAQIVGLNTIGLRRSGYSRQDMLQLKAAYRLIYRSGLRWSEVLEELQLRFSSGPAAAFREFFLTGTRGYIQERKTPRGAVVRLVMGTEEDETPATPSRQRNRRVA